MSTPTVRPGGDTTILLLLRHAGTEAFRPGRHDIDRGLTEGGHRQARAVGTDLRARGLRPDHVLCSPAVRTRQTLDGLELDPSATVELVDEIYQAGSDTLRGLLSERGETPERARTLLLIGHAPGIPRLALDLAGPDSDADALRALERGFPTATLAGLSLTARWDRLDAATTRLDWLSLH